MAVVRKERIAVDYMHKIREMELMTHQEEQLKKEDIQEILDRGSFAVMPLDMCGAIAMKQHFPTSIIFVYKEKEYLIRDILKEDYTIEEKTLRLLSIDAEKRNREICDFVIDNGREDALDRLVELALGTSELDDKSIFKMFLS